MLHPWSFIQLDDSSKNHRNVSKMGCLHQFYCRLYIYIIYCFCTCLYVEVFPLQVTLKNSLQFTLQKYREMVSFHSRNAPDLFSDTWNRAPLPTQAPSRNRWTACCCRSRTTSITEVSCTWFLRSLKSKAKYTRGTKWVDNLGTYRGQLAGMW